MACKGMESEKQMRLVGFAATDIAVINLLICLTHCLLCFQILFLSTFLGFKGQLENGKMLNKVKISLSKFSPKFNSQERNILLSPRLEVKRFLSFMGRP